MKNLTIIIFSIILLTSTNLYSQNSEDPVAKFLFEPELIMKNMKKIGVTKKQSQDIRQEVQAAQNKIMDLEWDVNAEMENVYELLSNSRIDESKALALIEKMMRFEREMQTAKLLMLVRVKNLLTVEQQEQLQKLKQ